MVIRFSIRVGVRVRFMVWVRGKCPGGEISGWNVRHSPRRECHWKGLKNIYIYICRAPAAAWSDGRRICVPRAMTVVAVGLVCLVAELIGDSWQTQSCDVSQCSCSCQAANPRRVWLRAAAASATANATPAWLSQHNHTAVHAEPD